MLCQAVVDSSWQLPAWLPVNQKNTLAVLRKADRSRSAAEIHGTETSSIRATSRRRKLCSDFSQLASPREDLTSRLQGPPAHHFDRSLWLTRRDQTPSFPRMFLYSVDLPCPIFSLLICAEQSSAAIGALLPLMTLEHFLVMITDMQASYHGRFFF